MLWVCHFLGTTLWVWLGSCSTHKTFHCHNELSYQNLLVNSKPSESLEGRNDAGYVCMWYLQSLKGHPVSRRAQIQAHRQPHCRLSHLSSRLFHRLSLRNVEGLCHQIFLLSFVCWKWCTQFHLDAVSEARAKYCYFSKSYCIKNSKCSGSSYVRTIKLKVPSRKHLHCAMDSDSAWRSGPVSFNFTSARHWIFCKLTRLLKTLHRPAERAEH